MKKKFIYVLTLSFFILASGFIILKYKNDASKNESQLFELLPAKGNYSQMPEWKQSKDLVDGLISKIEANPKDLKSLNNLTATYLQEARNSGNFSYYDNAAMHCVNKILEIDPKNFEGLTFKATIFMSQHHFTDGLNLAKEIVKLYPYSAFVYGILVDANVELGNYSDAVDAAEKMISLRPDLRSYSRISYLREIHGDINGAIEAMKLAVDAGSPGTESTEWTRVQLGKLYEQKGELQFAKMNYAIALQNRPGYPYALAGMGRIALSENKLTQAIDYFSKADSVSNDYTFKEALVEIHKLNGEAAVAKSLADDIIKEMEKAAEISLKDPAAGHYADREMAIAYLAVDNYDKALEHALLEYNRRPNNIDVNETLAWVYYMKKDFGNAVSYITPALKTNCRNPVLLCHAGLIYFKAGDKLAAKNYLQQALKDHPNIPQDLLIQMQNTLKSIN